MVGEHQEKQRKRDKAILDYLIQFGCARAATLETLFFDSYSACRRRLKRLTGYKAINRHRDHITYEYIYYITKPKQITHRLILTDLHRELIKFGVKILKFENELTIFDGIRPDGFLVGQHKEKDLITFIECERQKPNIEKYKEFYYSRQWDILGECPRVIWVTDKKVLPIKEVELIVIKEDLSNIKDILN